MSQSGMYWIVWCRRRKWEKALISFMTAIRSFTQLRKFCAERIPDIESRVENRNNLRKDFDSYRRRLKDLQNSKEPDREKLEHLRQKLESAKVQYEKSNSELIADFVSLKQSKESLLINQATAMFICQQEFFARAAKSLEGALQGLPTGTARKTEKSIEQFVRSGGPPFSPFLSTSYPPPIDTSLH